METHIKFSMQVIRFFVNLLILSFVVVASISIKGSRCGGGGEPPPQVPTESFGVEVDKMANSEWPSLDYIFTDAFKKARSNASPSYYYDEASIETQDWLDERNGEVTNFIYVHRGNFFSTYDGECYLCCVENIYSDNGVAVAGLAIWNSDPSIQSEAACAVATQHIQNQWINQNPQPTTPVVWYIAWASAHELGHCFCLYHCTSTGCIMNGEVNVASDPHKTYCATCAQTISTNWP